MRCMHTLNPVLSSPHQRTERIIIIITIIIHNQGTGWVGNSWVFLSSYLQVQEVTIKCQLRMLLHVPLAFPPPSHPRWCAPAPSTPSLLTWLYIYHSWPSLLCAVGRAHCSFIHVLNSYFFVEVLTIDRLSVLYIECTDFSIVLTIVQLIH